MVIFIFDFLRFLLLEDSVASLVKAELANFGTFPDAPLDQHNKFHADGINFRRALKRVFRTSLPSSKFLFAMCISVASCPYVNNICCLLLWVCACVNLSVYLVISVGDH